MRQVWVSEASTAELEHRLRGLEHEVNGLRNELAEMRDLLDAVLAGLADVRGIPTGLVARQAARPLRDLTDNQKLAPAPDVRTGTDDR